MADILPDTLTAGLTFNKTVSVLAHPAPEWSVSAVLRGPMALTLLAEADGASHAFRVTAAMSERWLPGQYAYSVRARRDDDVVELEAGTLTVKPDLMQLSAGHDARHHVVRVIEAIEAVLEKRATQDQEKYRINNRELWRTPVADLLKLRDRYRAELRKMDAVKKGTLFGGTVRVAFR